METAEAALDSLLAQPLEVWEGVAVGAGVVVDSRVEAEASAAAEAAEVGRF